jgi:two-component system cell cycle response regulator
MNARPFRLVVVADDRKVLRRLSRFLSVFGFRVETVADGEQARAICKSDPPDFLIVDGDSVSMEHGRQLFTKNRQKYVYSFLMTSSSDPEDLKEALVAGVDDFLAKPLIFGELLARLRSGARVLEYERRLREQSAIDQKTALLSYSAFQSRLQSEVDDDVDKSICCVIVDLDFFANANSVYGSEAGNEVLRAVAQQLKNMTGACKYLASFDDGRFAAMLPDSSDAKAYAWAESVRQSIAEMEIALPSETISITASIGVAGTMHDVGSANELIERAKAAVRMAKSSGRNCVARCGQFDGETREWEELARQGRLFENTVARDVMVPCPLFVRDTEDLPVAIELLENANLPEIPVVDRHGKVLGLLQADLIRDHDADRHGPPLKVADVAVNEVATVAENKSFGALMEFFMTDSPANHAAVVVRHKKPIGIVYRSGLAALSEPLNVGSFAPDEAYSTSTDYLVIPDFSRET